MKKGNLAIIVSIITIAIAVSLTGCGKKSVTVATPIRIVALLPETGPAGSYGKQMKAGIKLAAASMEGVQVEFVDSKGNPTEAVSAINQLLARGASERLGVIAALSSVSKAVVPVTQGRSVPTVLTCVATPNLVPASSTVISLFWTTDDFLPPVAKEIDLRHKRLAILTLADDYGSASSTTINNNLKSCQVVLNETFSMVGGDNETLAVKIAAASPDAVFIGGFGPNFIALINKIKTRVPNTIIYTSMDLGNPQVRTALGEAAEGIVFPALSPDLDGIVPERITQLKKQAEQELGEAVYVALFFYAHDALLRVVSNIRNATPLEQAAEGESVAALENGGLSLGVIKNGVPTHLNTIEQKK